MSREAPSLDSISHFEKSDLPLQGTQITVVGAGPGGLAFSTEAKLYGADVTVLEQAGDPRGAEAGYTNKSFNLTLNDVGRGVIRDERAWRGGVRVEGRVVHDPITGESRYASYGSGPEDHLTSIPRPTLRRNLADLAVDAGVELQFYTKVVDVDPYDASVLIDQGGSRQKVGGDLVVVSDGLHSIGDSLIQAQPEGALNLRPEPRNYVTANMGAEVGHGLSLNHLHYWHGSENGYTIGVPNEDGSISLLFISEFADIGERDSPFPTPQEARRRLAADFPQLFKLDPSLADQLPERARGRFHYKSVTHFAVGRTAWVGDAGHGAPPWAGFGANGAIFGAKTLASLLAQHGEAALPLYAQHRSALAKELSAYILEHGDFLSGRVASNPGDRAKPAMAELIRRACAQSVEVPTLSYL